MCSRTRAALAVVLTALTLSACGNKESPKPPPQIIPVPTLDLRVAQRGNELLLSFTYPTTTIAGAALGDLEAVELWELVREMRLVQPVQPVQPAPAAAATGTVAVAPPAAQRKEDLATIDAAEFVATAKLRLTLKEPELADAISGSKIAMRLPLEALPEPAPEAAAADEGAPAGAEGAPGEDAAQSPGSEESAGPAAADGDEEEDAAETGPLERVYLFAIKTVPARGLTSSYSNIVKIVQREPPPPPSGFEVEAGATGITLSWKIDGADEEEAEAADKSEESEEAEEPAKSDEAEVAEVAEEAEEGEGAEKGGALAPAVPVQGYRVYRRGAQTRAYGEPVRILPAGYSRVVDTTAEFGQRYIYAVTAVAVADPLVESAIAAEHEVHYEDRFPPLPPRNPIALPEAGAVRLIWDAVEDKDLLGYVVERAEGEGDFAALHEEPITDLELTDRDVVSGRDYRYRVYAVDAKGNRGRPSEAIEVRAP